MLIFIGAGNNIQKAYDEVEQSFIASNPKSKAIYDKATESLPGGNTRTSVFYRPFPVSIESAQKARLYDADGHTYVDLLGEFTAGLYGHSDIVIADAISKALQRGLSFGSQHEDEGKLAALVRGRFPSMDLLRFTNSGTEANLMAIAAAVHYTGRKKVMVFEGGYHGGAFIFKSGKSSPINAPYNYVLARYNDIESVQRLFKSTENVNNIAAIVVEPIIGSGGAIPADIDFLKALRRVASDSDTLLIFDEVMTSRMHEGGGTQSRLPAELRPDLTTLGKYIGGGMSFGAFSGKRSIMEMFDPRHPGSMAHAGTFNNNVLTMSAGRAGLEQVFTLKRAMQLHEMGEGFRRSLNEAARGTLMKVTGYGSILCSHFTKLSVDEIKGPRDLEDDYKPLGDLFHLSMLKRGYYMARSSFCALSLALTTKDLTDFVEEVEGFLHEYESLVKLPEQNGSSSAYS